MTEITISTRVDKHLAQELDGYMKIEHLEKASAVRQLLHKSIHEWKLEYALSKLEAGEFTLNKAAEFAEVDVFTLIAKIKNLGTKWVYQEGILEDLKAIK